MALRICVLSGQFGWALSSGMLTLAKELKPYGIVSTHIWRDPSVLKIVNNHAGRIALIGFSLGANQLGWIGENARRTIDLGCAIDPSRQSPLCVRLENYYVQTTANFRSMVCFYNPGTWFFGGSKYVGSNVRLVTINTFHLLAQANSEVHRIVIEEVQKLAGGGP